MMSSPRKFAEKIALIQQKQAEGDAAFNTIIYEVEAAKQVYDKESIPFELINFRFPSEPIGLHRQTAN